MQLLPLYRLKVFAPYSVDPTETTLLTPIGGAAHSDNFVVASAQNIAGAKPYLELPRGKQGSLDPSTKKVTTGRLVVRLTDARVTAGGSNAIRWFTAFIGDTSGKQRILRCRITLEESLDGTTGSLTTFFTGRIYGVTLASAQWVDLELRDIREELNQRRLFTVPPDASVSYASLPSALPPGAVQDWGQFPAVLGLLGSTSILSTYTGPKGGSVSSGRVTIDVTETKFRKVITKDIIGLAHVGTADHDAAVLGARVSLTRMDTLASGTFRVSPAAEGSDHIPAFEYRAGEDKNAPPSGTHGVLVSALLESLDPSETGYMAFPPNGTQVRFSIGVIHPVDQRSPLLINTQHAVQIWKDMLDGKFSQPNSDGTLRPLCAYDATAFTNLIADASIPAMQFYIDAVANNAIDWIEQYICLPRNLAYRFDPSGKLIPIDMRRTKDTATGVPTLVDDDLATEQGPAWSIARDNAVTGVEFTYYVDYQLSADTLANTGDYFPDIGPIQLDSTPTLVVLGADLTTLTDVGEKIVKIDSKGDRVFGPRLNGGSSGIVDIDSDTKQPTALSTALQTEAMLRDFVSTLATGPAQVSLRCRRTTTPSALYAGLRALVTVSKLPDSLTNQRGGTRLMLCVSRTEDGPYLNLDFIDEGSNVVAAVPTLNSAAIPADDAQAIDAQVTVNAASDAVHLWYARTDAATGTAPSVNSPLWLFGGMRTTTGLIRLRPMMKGTRVFLRAQSRSGGTKPKLPSDWAFIGGVANTSFVDVSAITAPSVVTVGSISGNRATVSWTNGDANKLTDVYVTAGGVPGTWTEAMRQQPPLTPGSTTILLTDLVLSTAYAVGVRHRDSAGGVSAFATQTFTTTNAASTALTPPPPNIGGGTGAVGAGISISPVVPTPRSGPRLNPGVAVLLYHTDPSSYLELQHAPDSAGSPNVGAATTLQSNIAATQKVFVHRVALDGATHWYRTRHMGRGDTASGWSDWVSGKPVIQPFDGPTTSVTHPLNAQTRYRARVRKSAVQSITSGVITTVTWDLEDYDLGSLHDTTVGVNTKIVVPTGGDVGSWLIIGSISWGANATGLRYVTIVKNGATALGESSIQAVNSGADATTHAVMAVDDRPTVGDYYEIQVEQKSGGALNVGTSISSFFLATHQW